MMSTVERNIRVILGPLGMEVLVACEFSGTVRDAFAKRGHKVLSCDLLASESPGPHYAGSVFDVIDYPWDLGIFHFPCTHTSVSGAAHFADKWSDGRQACGVALFMQGWKRANHIPRVCFEHPVSIMSRLFRKPDQIIQPWQYGHPESKATCLWLRGLPKLEPTKVCEPAGCGRWENQTASGQNKLGPSPERAKIRSRTYAGIADAMAEQWGTKAEARQMPLYACPCGCAFEEGLGKYGCPDCCGDSGAARLNAT